MKKSICYIIPMVCVLAFLLASCSPTTGGYSDEELIGVWRCQTTKTDNPDGYYYVVFSAEKDETGEYRLGKEWDEGDDVKEEEAQVFKWKLDIKDLTQIHWMEINETWGVPKYYTITLLTSTSLSYTNQNRTYTFSKVADYEVSPTDNGSEDNTEGKTEGGGEDSTTEGGEGNTEEGSETSTQE